MNAEHRYFPPPTERKKHILYSVLDPSTDVEAILGYTVPITPIPRNNLFGIQTRQEYERTKIKSIRDSYAVQPNHLESNPILVCALPAFPFQGDEALERIQSDSRYYLTITDGHHRVRFAPHAIREIPGRILTVAEAVKVTPNLTDHHYAAAGKSELKVAYNQLVGWMSETIRSFVEEIDRPDLDRTVSTLQLGKSRADMIIV